MAATGMIGDAAQFARTVASTRDGGIAQGRIAPPCQQGGAAVVSGLQATHGRVAEPADARDLKSRGVNTPYRFESGLSYYSPQKSSIDLNMPHRPSLTGSNTTDIRFENQAKTLCR